jgi:Ca2+-binding RTX toxin-like protein
VKISFTLRLLIFGLAALIIINIVTAFAATNTVQATNVAYKTISVGINDKKPSACTGWSLENLITGSGSITGTEGNDLILGSSGADTIDGLGGDDCILGGGDDDLITGGDGVDVCIGGPGTNTFVTCEAQIP